MELDEERLKHAEFFLKWLKQYKVGKFETYRGVYIISEGAIQALYEIIAGIE